MTIHKLLQLRDDIGRLILKENVVVEEKDSLSLSIVLMQLFRD